jgi:hypothetical protein
MADEILVGLSAIFGAMMGSIIGPIIQNWLSWKQKQREVEWHQIHVRYSDMIGSVPAFHSGRNDPEGVKKFTAAYRLAWLYVPDEVIVSINNFLVSAGAGQREESEADKNLRNMIWNMRKALKKKTKLKQEQFLIVGP